MTALMRHTPLLSSRTMSRYMELAPGGRAVERKALFPPTLPRIVHRGSGGDDACCSSFSRRRCSTVASTSSFSSSSSYSSASDPAALLEQQQATAPIDFLNWPPDPSILPQGPAAPFLVSLPSPNEIVAVNFYHLVDLPSARATRKRHEAFLKGRDVRGRIYIAPQGINAQFSAPAAVAAEYLIWVKNESEKVGEEGGGEVGGEGEGEEAALPPPSAARAAASAAASRSLLETMRANSEPSPRGEHLFPKLRLKYKPNLISLAGGTASLPITDPEARAVPLSPKQWEEMLLKGENEKRPIVLDVRNAYEWDAGHFAGAERPLEDNFCETPTDATATSAAASGGGGGGENENEESDAENDDEDGGGGVSSPSLDVPAYLASAPKDAPVMMYCTGGIRCDIYSAHLRQKGFTNLYTLEGGVHSYFNQVGGRGWEGSLFVFDARMAVAPKSDDSSSSDLGSSSSDASSSSSSAAALEEEEGEEEEDEALLPAAAPCLLCGGRASLPHLNCSNIDCNRLFISCRACASKLFGCCCEACTAAPRLLRPAKASGYYGTWASEAEELAAAAATGGDGEAAAAAALAAARAAMSSGRGSGRLARRRARAERLSRERAAAKEEQLRKKAAARAELAKREGSGGGGERKGEDGRESVEDGERERAARLAKLVALRSRLLVRR